MNVTLAFLGEAAEFIQTAPIVIQTVAAVIFLFVLLFILRFVIPGIWIWFRLRGVAWRLRRLRKTEDRNPAPIFARSRTLAHLWTEYEDTLHEQRAFDTETGTLKPAVLRSTVPAARLIVRSLAMSANCRKKFFTTSAL